MLRLVYFIHLELNMEEKEVGIVIYLPLIKTAVKLLSKASFETFELPLHEVSW